MNNQSLYLLVGGFFFIALIYASVGFGGGSSYLALLAQPMFLLMPDVIRPTALLCNIIVVTGGTIIFYREGKINWKDVWPFLIASVPLAWLGGLIRLDDRPFFLLLGCTLILASIFLWKQPKQNTQTSRWNRPIINASIGGIVGFLSGLVSIGGGIFLSPILHLLNWNEAKRISALAGLFILVNSISGLAGQWQRSLPTIEWNFILPLLAAVFMGGQLGSRLGARTFNPIYIRRITATLILVAGVNILLKHF